MEKREHKRQRQNKERIIRLRWATAIVFHCHILVIEIDAKLFGGSEVLVLSSEPWKLFEIDQLH